MFQSYHLQNSGRSSTNNCFQAGSPLHSCPYCRCKSLDSSINIKIVAKPQNGGCSIRLGREFIDKKMRGSKIDQRTQNVYYRTFDSPRKSGLLPNGNRKITIQYSSPEHLQRLKSLQHLSPPVLLQTSQVLSSKHQFPKPAFHQPIQKSTFANKITSSPLQSSPRNIYTNQNTPPKAKFLLQKKKSSSRKNSEDNNKILQSMTPMQGLDLVDSQRIKKPLIEEDNNKALLIIKSASSSSSQDEIKNNRKQSTDSRQVSITKEAVEQQYFSKIPQTQTKNIIQRLSGQSSSLSPFNSLINSSPQVTPYQSMAASPLADKNAKKHFDPSIKQFGGGFVITTQGDHRSNNNNSSQTIIRMIKNTSTPIIENNTPIQQSSKLIELTPQQQKQQRYSYQKFDKTLGKVKYHQDNYHHNENYNQLMYSQSDIQQHQALRKHYNYGGSEKQIPSPYVSSYHSQRHNENHSRSQQNIRPISSQQQTQLFSKKIVNKNNNKFQTMQMSDNFSTPNKSKCNNSNRVLKEQNNNSKEQNNNSKEAKKESKKNSSIRFYPLGDNNNRKSKMSQNSINSKKDDKISYQKVSMENNNWGNDNNSQNNRVNNHNTKNIQQQQWRSSLNSASNYINSQQNISQPNQKQSNTGANKIDNQHINQQAKTPKPSSNNQYAAELTEQLKLNYDYYFYRPIFHGQLYSSSTQKQNRQHYRDNTNEMFVERNNTYVVRDSSISENEQIDITF